VSGAAIQERKDYSAVTREDDRMQFAQERQAQISKMGRDEDLKNLAHALFLKTVEARYSYHFDWCGLPIIQYPADVLALQEIIWSVRPKRIVETGVARGGSLLLSASLLDVIGEDGRVVGVDIDIRPHNRRAIENHPLAHRIDLVEGSSVEAATIAKVFSLVGDSGPVLVLLDSNHAHEHVLSELRAYSPLVGAGSYIVVYDTVIEDMPERMFKDRPWGPGNSPKTAVHQFLKECDRFEIDRHTESKLLLTVCPDGFLRCVKNP
jgi:cephalosporin hydroxylase